MKDLVNNHNLHKPVMLKEVLAGINPKDNEIYLDATFGCGGYSQAILESANCKVYAIDRDLNSQKLSDQLTKNFKNRFVFLRGNFSQSKNLLLQENISKIDGMVFDLGVSSIQLDDKNRGFSFDSEERLDMRMDQLSYPSAYEVVNEKNEKELEEIIRNFGEEPKAKQISKRIVEKRKDSPIKTCKDLAKIIQSFYPQNFKTHPATKTFQAIRIYVNCELEEIELALQSSVDLLKPNGRLVVVSFHSLEDFIVKKFLKEKSGKVIQASRYFPQTSQQKEEIFKIITKSAISPTEEEITENPRSRSAKMRIAIKVKN
jgi:16S rRNA (cytosine1402-N4)-methyltransferase